MFKSKGFQRFARSSAIDDASLLEAVQRAEQGLIDADLGGGVIKQRVARRGEGKSGGFRTIILFRSGDKAIFIHGFEKSEAHSNISAGELRQFKRAAKIVLNLTSEEITRALKASVYIELTRK